jgi:hypothetical protein
MMNKMMEPIAHWITDLDSIKFIFLADELRKLVGNWNVISTNLLLFDDVLEGEAVFMNPLCIFDVLLELL